MTGPDFILKVAEVLGESAIRVPMLRAVLDSELHIPDQAVLPSKARDLFGREGLQKLIAAGLGGRSYDIPSGQDLRLALAEWGIMRGVVAGHSNMKIAFATFLKEREVIAIRNRLRREGRLPESPAK